jgi:ferredoxin
VKCRELYPLLEHLFAPEMVVDEDKCIGCGDCIDRCQFEALSMQDGIVARDADSY